MPLLLFIFIIAFSGIVCCNVLEQPIGQSPFKKDILCSQSETASVDADIQKEYARQREHLERSVASLRKKLVKDTEIHRADNVRIMQVSTLLANTLLLAIVHF